MPYNKNICIVGPSKRFLSGISYYTIRLANAMSKSNNVSVVLFRKLLPKFLFPGKEHVGKNLSDLDFNKNIKVFNGMDYNSPISWIKGYNFIKKQNPDVIILQWWTSSVAHIHLILKMFNIFFKSKIIIEFHEVVDPLEESIYPIRLYSRVTGRLLRRNLSGYVVHSNSDKKLISEKYNIHKEKIHVIPHGLYDQYLPMDKNLAKEILNKEYLGNIKKEFIILFFGLIRKYKGVSYLIDSFNKLPKEIIKNSRLIIAGEIWEDDNIKEKIKASIYKDKITLIPKYIFDAEIPIYFSAADVVALPYLRASQSGVAHIAVNFGKPIIVSEVGGLKESMADYEGTIFVPPADSNAIANAIIKCYKHNKVYKPQERDWNTIVEMYQKVIEKS